MDSKKSQKNSKILKIVLGFSMIRKIRIFYENWNFPKVIIEMRLTAVKKDHLKLLIIDHKMAGDKHVRTSLFRSNNKLMFEPFFL